MGKELKKGISIGYTSCVNQGKVREYQQDRLLVLQKKKLGILLAIADGMGGHSGGDVAAELALETIENLSENLIFHKAPSSKKEYLLSLQRLFHEANTAVFLQGALQPHITGMGTTLVVGWIPPLEVTKKPYLVVSWCGDSMLYLSRKMSGRRKRLFELVDPHNFGHSLIHCIGPQKTTTVEGQIIELYNKDKIILCSDGLSGYPVTQKIVNKYKTAQDLVQYALDMGGQDNVSVIVAEVTFV